MHVGVLLRFSLINNLRAAMYRDADMRASHLGAPLIYLC
jgi:hypothetical protein